MDTLFPHITAHGKWIVFVLAWIGLSLMWFEFMDRRALRSSSAKNVLKMGYTQRHKKEDQKMRNIMMVLLLLCSMSLPGFGQASPKYQAATIVNVLAVQSAHDAAPNVYHISVKLDDTVYVIRYVSEEGDSVKYMAGMQLPVLIGDETLKFNDLLGNSHEVPIVKRQPATTAKAK